MPIKINPMGSSGGRPKSALPDNPAFSPPKPLSDGNEQENPGEGTGATPSPMVARLVRMVRAEARAVAHWDTMSATERSAYSLSQAGITDAWNKHKLNRATDKAVRQHGNSPHLHEHLVGLGYKLHSKGKDSNGNYSRYQHPSGQDVWHYANQGEPD